MSTTDYINYSIDIDNQTSTSSAYYTIVPSFVDLNSDARWTMMYRPNYENKTLAFATLSDKSSGIDNGGDNSWCTNNVAAHFVLSLNTVEQKWSVSPYFTRTIKSAESNGSYYATFSSDYSVAIPEGMTAYYAPTSQSTAGRISLTAFENGIYAGEGAFLKTSGSSVEYTFIPAASTDHSDTESNLLKAGKSTGVSASTTDSYNYVFANTNGLGFYKVESDLDVDLTGKAYLHSTAALDARLALSFDDDVTGINSVKTAMLDNGTCFNLAGQRVVNPAKGLYIVNGKKVVIK